MTEWARWARVPVGPGAGLDLMHARRRAPFARHAHAEYAIGVCLDGQEHIDIAGSVHHAGPGSVVVIEPGRVHDGAPANAPSFRYRVLYARPDQLMVLAGVGQWPQFRSPVLDDPVLAAGIAAAHRLLGAGGDPLEAETLLVAGLGRLVARHAAPSPRTEPQPGTPPPPPPPPAAAVGFADQAHLTRWFRRVLGVTPGAYRNSVQDPPPSSRILELNREEVV